MSESKINMSLDDIIKKERKNNKQGGNSRRNRTGPNVGKFRGNRKLPNLNTRSEHINRNRQFTSERGGRNANNISSRRGDNRRVRYTNTRIGNQNNNNNSLKKRVKREKNKQFFQFYIYKKFLSFFINKFELLVE